jgi:uncharacterized protein YjbJ (UPF0337 family)
MELKMNNNRIDGAWEQIKGHVQKTWGKLTDNDLDEIEGNRKLLAGKVKERYGMAEDEVDKQVHDWNNEHDHEQKAHDDLHHKM